MITVDLPESVKCRLEHLARATGRTKSFHVQEALLSYLEEIEDVRAAEETLARVRDGKERVFSSEEVGKLLDAEEGGR